MCGHTMRPVVTERTEPIPGHAQANRSVVREWVCPECDYFEEETGE